MKRKLSFNFRTLKLTTTAVDPAGPVDPAETGSVSSLDFNPPSPYIDRRPLTPETQANLRHACLFILEAHDPTSEGPPALKQSEAWGRVSNQPGRTQSQRAESSAPKRWLSSRHGDRIDGSDVSSAGPSASTFKYVPRNAANSFRETTKSRSQSVNRSRSTSCGQLDQGPAAGLERPQTAAPTFDSSTSTTASTNTWATSARHSKSTGITTMPSHSHTPAEYHDAADAEAKATATAQADARARAWMAEELARRRAEQDRPASRGRSIVEYIRPRSSNNSLRSSYTSNEGQTTPWWRGGSLRRPGSSQSLRAAAEPKLDAFVAPEVDLNRALPPLPSLATYDAPTSVADVKMGPGSMTGGSRVMTSHSSEQPSLLRQTTSEREESQRMRELQEAVERKLGISTAFTAPGPAATNGRPPRPASRTQRTESRRLEHPIHSSDGSGSRSGSSQGVAGGDNKMTRLKRQLSRFGLNGYRSKAPSGVMASAHGPQTMQVR
ncbi:MAG: hypothetical protein M1838_000255 [Thelocarpon superellum]|nr:MAG: hypothetical protein M1838_000255 [Thelocarpon superellum]